MVGITRFGRWWARVIWNKQIWKVKRFDCWKGSGWSPLSLALWDWDSYPVKCISWYLMPLPWERMSSLSWFAWDFPIAVPDRSLPFQNPLSSSRAGLWSPVLDSGIQGWYKTLNGFFLLSTHSANTLSIDCALCSNLGCRAVVTDKGFPALSEIPFIWGGRGSWNREIEQWQRVWKRMGGWVLGWGPRMCPVWEWGETRLLGSGTPESKLWMAGRTGQAEFRGQELQVESSCHWLLLFSIISSRFSSW